MFVKSIIARGFCDVNTQFAKKSEIIDKKILIKFEMSIYNH